MSENMSDVCLDAIRAICAELNKLSEMEIRRKKLVQRAAQRHWDHTIQAKNAHIEKLLDEAELKFAARRLEQHARGLQLVAEKQSLQTKLKNLHRPAGSNIASEGKRGGLKPNYATVADNTRLPPTTQPGHGWTEIDRTPDSKR